MDIVVNGYELTPERLRTAAATIPYYVYELVLFAHRDDQRLSGWEGLKHLRPDGALAYANLIRAALSTRG